MTSIVISQPMFWPWRGLFEQLRQADIYVHYDDVQYPRGRSFMNRVQVKQADGVHWLTAPIRRMGESLIREVRLDHSRDWSNRHLKTLKQAYAKAPYKEDMLALAEMICRGKYELLCDYNIAAIETIARYWGFNPVFLRSSQLNAEGRGSQRLLNILRLLNGTRYITGHGARNYLDHHLLEAQGVRVEYMRYQNVPYPQLHGDFTPYVTILDLVANMGTEGASVICSGSIDWREFINDA